MINKIPSILIFCILLLLGCSGTPHELNEAEKFVDTAPDSALRILKNIKLKNYTRESDKALYGLLLCKVSYNKNLVICNDSLMNLSLNYYIKKNDKIRIAECYFYLAREYMLLNKYENSTYYNLKAIEISKTLNYDELSGRLYSLMGDISFRQLEYKIAREKYFKALHYFNSSGNILKAEFCKLDIGRTYMAVKDYKTALSYYNKGLISKDSLLVGQSLQEIGILMMFSEHYDSTLSYLRTRLNYPVLSYDNSVIYYALGNSYFYLKKYDSASYYAKHSLKFKANNFTIQDCYRILVNCEYLKNNIKQMGVYMSKYQDYADSVRIVSSQTKISDLEKLQKTSEETNEARRDSIYIILFTLVAILLTGIILVLIYKRYQRKKKLFEEIKEELTQKNEFVVRNLSKKIEEIRNSQLALRKNATVEERYLLDKELYIKGIYINDWERFSIEMNNAFNNIIEELNKQFKSITHKEIIWCCLELLNVPNSDKLLLLESTPDSLYKLKQRLAKKFNLSGTKELNNFLNELTKKN